MEDTRYRSSTASRLPKQLLFVCGCPRSGTTAMRQLLSGHPHACIGMERYATIANRREPLSEVLFEKERFLTLQPGDTFYDRTRFDEFHDGFAEKFDSCRYVGDKIPCLYKRWEDVFALQPPPIVIFLVRNILDVAESYNHRARDIADSWPATKNAITAVREWNTSLRLAAEAIDAGHESQFLIVEYEGFFERKQRMRGLLSHLGLSIDERDTRYLNEIAAEAMRVHLHKNSLRELTPQQKRHLSLSAHVGRYRQLLSRATGWMSADFGRDGDVAVGSNEAA